MCKKILIRKRRKKTKLFNTKHLVYKNTNHTKVDFSKKLVHTLFLSSINLAALNCLCESNP